MNALKEIFEIWKKVIFKPKEFFATMPVKDGYKKPISFALTIIIIYAVNNFGDSNGTWGVYAQLSGQVNAAGTECSGSSGNHSDKGTAGTANADQASAY